MGILSKLRRKAQSTVAERSDQIDRGIDTVAGLIDSNTEGRHSTTVEKAAASAKKAANRVSRRPGGPSHL